MRPRLVERGSSCWKNSAKEFGGALEFALDAEGARYWNGEPLSRAEAAARFKREGLLQPQPEVHLRADQSVSYCFVAETLADASEAGLSRIGFVSQPESP